MGDGEAVCVGDDPYTDFWGAKQLGMRAVRVLCGEFKDVHLSEEYEAEIVLHNLAELLGLLSGLTVSLCVNWVLDGVFFCCSAG